MKKAYSLIELIVVIGVIAAIFAISLPSFTSINDNYALSIATNHITDYLTRARVQSMAATEAGLGKNQFYQVRLSGFVNTSQTFPLAIGTDSATWKVTLESGSGQCGVDSDATTTSTLDSYTLPNKIYIKEYFPFKLSSALGSNEAFDATIRFSQGKMGFSCGDATSPELDSTKIIAGDSSWRPVVPGAAANEAYIKLLNSRTSKPKYIYIDRFSGQASTSDNSKYNVVASSDIEAPIWKWDGFPTTGDSVTATCADKSLDLNVSFNKAKDKANGSVDDTGNVYYDIYYALSPPDNYDLANYTRLKSLHHDTVSPLNYNTSVTLSDCPSNNTPVRVIIVTYDESGNIQGSETNASDPIINAGKKIINGTYTTL